MKTTPPEEISAPGILEDLVRKAESAGASDVHLQMTGKAAHISFRLDGVMTPASELPDIVADRVFGRIKYLARLKTYQESMPQEGRIERSQAGSANDIRVATYPTVTGEKIVLRLFVHASSQTLDELHLHAEVQAELNRFLSQTSGLLLLTGPAGSGKTTTIYACLRRLVEMGGRHIITVEDPAERIIPGVMQTEISEARGLTFAAASRHLLRQDPQVLVIGEIRDEETAQIAVRAALTGHMVISTLHAGSCQGVYNRMRTLCADQHAVNTAIELIVNQRLLRRLCPACKGAGCESCLHTGYRGRVPVLELFRADDEIRTRILEHGPNVVQPKTKLRDAARAMIDQGITDEREFKRVMG